MLRSEIFAEFHSSARQRPEKPGIVLAGRSISVSALLQCADAISSHLNAGSRPGIACDSADPIEFVSVLLACLKTRTPVVIAAPEREALQQVLSDNPGLIRVTTSEGSILLEEMKSLAAADGLCTLAREQPRYSRRRTSVPDDVSCILYTSGTTGRPVGIMTTEQSYLLHARELAQLFDISSADNLVLCSPMYHSYGLSLGVMLPLVFGMTIYPLRFHHPRPFIKSIGRINRPVLVATPSVYRAMIQYTNHLTALPSGHIKLCFSSGDVLPLSVRRRFEDDLGIKIIDCYGSTETSGIAISTERSGEFSILPSVRIRLSGVGEPDTTSEEEGELMVSGPKLMRGYLGQMDITETRMSDGWFNTHDRVRIQREGRFLLCGRHASMIRVAGQRVHAEQVERHLEAFNGIEEALVFGIPDAEHGEVLAAHIKPVEHCSVDIRKITTKLGLLVPAYMLPRKISVVSEIPKKNGKKVRCQRQLTRQEYS